MDYEDQQTHDHEVGDMQQMGPSYDSLQLNNNINNNNNSALTRPSKLPTSPVALDVEPQSQLNPRYRECRKNHAVSLGAQAVDGCGDFLPAGPEGTLDALKCAVCSCHRNFHRKETYPIVPVPGVVMDPYQIHHLQNTPPPPPPPPPLLTHYPHHQQQQFTPPYYHRSIASPSGYLQVGPPPPHQLLQRPPPLALPSNSGGGGEEGMNSGGEGGTWGSKKRFRTKFTAEQKDRMVAFANRLGWRIQKTDEEMVQQFCRDNGLKRHVLKVWMHNNKHTIGMGKQEELKND